MISRTLAIGGAAVLLLAGCTSPSAPDSDSDPVDPGPPDADGSECFTGAPWSLNLDDYAAQAESYMAGLGIPISDFVMSGSQTVQFTTDGLMAVETDITSTGVLQLPDGPFPVNVHSGTGGSGDWSLGSTGFMDITNWSTTEADPAPADPTDVDVPVPDFSVIPTVGVTCQPGLLSLTAPDSPFVPLFSR